MRLLLTKISAAGRDAMEMRAIPGDGKFEGTAEGIAMAVATGGVAGVVAGLVGGVAGSGWLGRGLMVGDGRVPFLFGFVGGAETSGLTELDGIDGMDGMDGMDGITSTPASGGTSVGVGLT